VCSPDGAEPTADGLARKNAAVQPMRARPRRLEVTARRLLAFTGRVLADFMRNRGILLAGGVGYNFLLSIVPLFIVCAALLSSVVDEGLLVDTIRTQAQIVSPGHAALLVGAVEEFLASRAVVGVVGFVVLLFFSGLAFRMLEDAMAIIFRRRAHPTGRSLWVSALLPYLFVLVLTAAVLALTVLAAMVGRVSGRSIGLFGIELSLERAPAAALYTFGFIGLGLLFASLYKVLPVTRVCPRRALVGGFVAAILWEMTLSGLRYYFENISLVNAIYGSFATLVVVLLGLELGALILLFGAQVIAELERSAAAGVPWYQEAGTLDPPEGPEG
jgi:membrane protein